MKQMTWIITTLLVGILAGCNTEEPFMDELVTTSHIVTITAGSEDNATKAAISDALAFTWTTGDQIAVHTTDGYKTSSALTSGDSPSATFTVDLGEGTRQNYAVYPASAALASYATAENLRVHYADTYSYNSNADFSPMVMIAKGNAPGTNLSFKHVGALVRMTVNNIPPEATKLTFTFQYKVTGDFPVSNPDTDAPDVTTTTSESDNVVTFHLPDHAGTWWDGKVFNIPVPCQVMGTVVCAAFKGSDKLLEGTCTIPNMTRAKGTKKTIYLPVFSVSDTKKVTIAKSNLQATTSNNWSTYSFSFMEYPWSIVETTNVSADYSGSTAVGLFGWATSGYNSKNPNMTSTTDSEYGPNISSGEWTVDSNDWDWGYHNSIGGYSNHIWRVLTSSEWLYLFGMTANNTDNGTITSRYLKYGRATVAGVEGIVIVPDDFIDPRTNGGSGSFTGGTGSAFTSNIYTSGTDWNAMAAAGAVFLPIANVRNGTILEIIPAGLYWSSTAMMGNNANHLVFSSSGIFPNMTTNRNKRYYGKSVRLVRDL